MFRLQERYKKIGTSQVFDGLNRYQMRMGDDGGDSTPQPTTPTAPSYGSTIQDYITQYPKLFDLLKQYAPQEAQLSYDIQKQLYPTTTGLQEQLAGVASKGVGADAPDWYKNQMNDTLSAKFGRNQVFNPLGQQAYGAEYQSGLQNWQKYYNDLGLAVSGRQPLTQPTNNITSTYAPSQAAGYNAALYNTQAGMYGQQLNAYGQSQNKPNPWANMLGSIGGNMGGSMLGNMGNMFGGGSSGGGSSSNSAGLNDWFNSNSGSNYYSSQYGY